MAGVVAALTGSNVMAQPGGGGGNAAELLQQMAADMQQRISQADPAQLQDLASRFNPQFGQMDPSQFQQMVGQFQQRVQNFTEMDPSQLQQMMEQWQQGQGVDPTQLRQGNVASLREQLGITNDVEWNLVNERIQKVQEAQRVVQNDSGTRAGLLAMNLSGNVANRLQGQGSALQALAARSTPPAEAGTLQKAVTNHSPDEETRTAIDRLNELRKTHRDALRDAQTALRLLLTVKQEAVATVNGLL